MIVEDDLSSSDDYEIVYSHGEIAKNGRRISKMISEANKYEPSLMVQPADIESYMDKILDCISFKKLLKVYENNQMIYADFLYDPNIISELTRLEMWFIRMIEPPPIVRNKILQKEELNEWYEREKGKLTGHTWYCRPDCTMTVIGDAVMSHVIANFDIVNKFYQDRK